MIEFVYVLSFKEFVDLKIKFIFTIYFNRCEPFWNSFEVIITNKSAISTVSRIANSKRHAKQIRKLINQISDSRDEILITDWNHRKWYGISLVICEPLGFAHISSRTELKSFYPKQPRRRRSIHSRLFQLNPPHLQIQFRASTIGSNLWTMKPGTDCSRLKWR